jgi:hypothetical protein
MGSESGPLQRRHCGKGQRRSRALSIDLFSVLTVVRVRPFDRYVAVCFRALRSPVACLDCGMRAEVRLEPSGLRSNITDTVSKCKRNRRGMDVVGCPGLKPELLRAAAALRENEHR